MKTNMKNLITALASVVFLGIGSVTAFAQDITNQGSVRSITCFGAAITTAGTCTTSGQIPGTSNATAASAGNIGEILSVTLPVGSAVNVSNSAINVTSRVLTAGNWSVCGSISFTNVGSSTTRLIGGISLTSATLPAAGPGLYDLSSTAAFPPGNSYTFPLGCVPTSLPSGGTVYLVAQTVTAGSSSVYGNITATRTN